MNKLLLILLVLLGMSGCGNGSDNIPIIGDTLTHEAHLLTLIDCKDYKVAQVKDPWHPESLLDTYILVPKSDTVERKLPKGTVVKVPLERTIIYSGVHGNAINQMGKLGAIVGVTEPEYFTTPRILERLKSGKLQAVGSSMQPAIEKIISLTPEAILLSPYENAGVGAVGELKIPIIQMADYMESTPLGRAEWIKFLGALFGTEDEANKIFNASHDRYNQLVKLASTSSKKPIVLTEQVTDGVWFVPGGQSYQARLLQDAGAKYPWASDMSTGSLQLDFSQVFDRAHNADIWLLKSQQDINLADVEANFPLNREIKAYKQGGIWNANTLGTTMFDDFPFKPDTLLRDYITIFHPELSLGEPTYFKHVGE